MRPRIKVINTESGVKVVQKKDVRGLFTVKDVTAIKVTTSGTRAQIENKLSKRMKQAQIVASEHMRELTELVRQNHIKTKYFAA